MFLSTQKSVDDKRSSWRGNYICRED